MSNVPRLATWLRGRTSSVGQVRGLSILGALIALAMLVLGVLVLLDARNDAWQQSARASDNLASALERDISRTLEVDDLSVQGAIKAYQQPGIDGIPARLRQMALFDSSASAEFLGSLLVIDEHGDVVADSTSLEPHRLNLADREYFITHQHVSNFGRYLSRPFESRMRPGDPSISISRRLDKPDHSFGGVVSLTLRLAYFDNLFAKLNLGPNGAVTLLRDDGTLIARYPYQKGNVGRDLRNSDTYRSFAAGRSGHFVATAMLDGVRRFYTYRHIDGLPLILSIAVSVEDVYAAWWHKAAIMTAALAILWLATITLCVLYRRDALRRIAAAEELHAIASTDALTGIGNRRAFETALDREWRRSIRAEMPVALLMLDADWFKLFNDCHGHPEGDQVLTRIAMAISHALRRPADTGARYGGEEFVILLPETEVTGALHMAERIRAGIERLQIAHGGSPKGMVTASIGVAVHRPQFGEQASLLIKSADEALYEAKRTGRNRVELARRSPEIDLWDPASAAIAK